jgi:hypothetical protein
VFGSNLGRDTGYPKVFCDFPSPMMQTPRRNFNKTAEASGQILPNSFSFIYHSIIWRHVSRVNDSAIIWITNDWIKGKTIPVTGREGQ